MYALISLNFSERQIPNLLPTTPVSEEEFRV